MSATTDTERLDILAERLNRLVLYEGNCRVEFGKPGRKQVGMSPDFLRSLADGLIRWKAGVSTLECCDNPNCQICP